MVAIPDPNHFHSLYFDLQVRFSLNHFTIRMELFTDALYSSKFPNTLDVLNKALPDIYQCHCFNYKKQKFSEEVKDTELGHLFEHIILECLAMHNKTHDENPRVYNGVTSWNWEKDREGVFHIKIDAGKREKQTISDAIAKGIRIIDIIIGKDDNLRLPSAKPAPAFIPIKR